METNGEKPKCSNCYEVVVWKEGDVTFHLPEEMIFTTLGAQCGLQCNFEEDSEEFKALLTACSTIAHSFAVVDKIIKNKKDE